MVSVAKHRQSVPLFFAVARIVSASCEYPSSEAEGREKLAELLSEGEPMEIVGLLSDQAQPCSPDSHADEIDDTLFDKARPDSSHSQATDDTLFDHARPDSSHSQATDNTLYSSPASLYSDSEEEGYLSLCIIS